jgi:hypothetical protein
MSIRKSNERTLLNPSSSSASLSSLDVGTSSGNRQQSAPAANRFTSNLAAVLNDPNKDRAKVNHLFTKTWGYDFTDVLNISSINTIHSNYKNHKISEFNSYVNGVSEVSVVTIINAGHLLGLTVFLKLFLLCHSFFSVF